MRSYDKHKPLIFIHIPKTAGLTVRSIVSDWFPENLHLHYFDRSTDRLPNRLPSEQLNDPDNPPVLYGHFNKLRKFGIEDYYPEVDQFLTIMRDPFETIVSQYFFVRKIGSTHKFYPATQVSLVEYVRNVEPYVLNHFPREMTLANYKDILEERFIEIGITEMLPQSLAIIATKLGKPFDPTTIPIFNKTKRDQPVSEDSRAAYAERNPLELAIYNYAKTRLIATGA